MEDDPNWRDGRAMNVPRPPIETRALEGAAWWRAKLDGEDVTESDWLSYEEWLSETPENRAAAARVDETIATIQANEQMVIKDGSPNGARPPRRWLASSALWASAAAAAAAAALLFIPTPQPPTELAYATPADRARVVELPDGTQVHLNRSTLIRVRFGAERRVELSQGEASFDVFHDPSHPFEVAAGEVSIRDVGTEFNVARNAQSLVVSVRSGEVAVTAAHAPSTRVQAGRMARVSAGAIAVVAARTDDAFAWQSGHLVYHDATLSAVLEDFNRYSAKPIVLTDDKAANLHFSGILAIDEPRTMLAHLQEFLPIQASDDGHRIVVRSST
ncbi:MAG: FecR domain-containing protein [Proteobacteria bacterium]|nr:FecR domain-containing protein [Pseudomonadota bacterium]